MPSHDCIPCLFVSELAGSGSLSVCVHVHRRASNRSLHMAGGTRCDASYRVCSCTPRRTFTLRRRDAWRLLLAQRFSVRVAPINHRVTVVSLRKTWPLLIVAVVIVLGSVAAVRTVVNSGPAAIGQMDREERVLLAKLETLRRGMSRDEVTAVLGVPDDEGPLGLRPKWQVNGNPLNAIVVYILPDGAHRVAWISVGRFHYERNL